MNWVVNGESYEGKIAVGDTLECNGLVYAVLGITNDGVVVKELKQEDKNEKYLKAGC